MAEEHAGQEGERRGPRWTVVLVVAIVVLACCILAVLGGGAAWLIWGPAARDMPWRESAIRRATRVQTIVPSATPTPSPTPTETVAPTATQTPAQPAKPTPVVCDGIDSLSGLTLAPGQAFRCTVTGEELNAELAAQPELPCQPASLVLVEDEIVLTCRVAGFDLSITLALEVDDCRADIRVVGGAPGLTEFIEEQIAENMELVPYDQVCVERATVTEGAVTVEGYRY